MDIRKIKKLVEILEESDLAELEITENEESVRLSRYPTNLPTPNYAMPMAAPMTAPVAAPAPAPAAAAPAAAASSEPDEAATLEGQIIRSPMVGTFYASPNPESEPFVSVGSDIGVGDVVCVIEAMKMFNQIESEAAGKIASVLVENGQPVEFDQPLFIVR